MQKVMAVMLEKIPEHPYSFKVKESIHDLQACAMDI
jgi:hypothetical protein